MRPYLVFNDIVNPDTGYFHIDLADSIIVAVAISRIWEHWSGQVLREAYPKITPANLQLFSLLEPLVEHDEGRVLHAMKEYTGDKRRMVGTESLDPNLPEDQVVFELRVNLPLPLPKTLGALTIVGEARLQTIQCVNRCARPSIIADTHTAFTYALQAPIFYDGRTATGPPVTIYHQAFARLKQSLEYVDKIGIHEGSALPFNILAKTAQLFAASLGVYDNEKARLERIVPLLNDVLDVQLVCDVKIHDGQNQSRAVEFDAAELVRLQDSSRQDNAAIYVGVGSKNELGMKGAGGVQVAATYAHLTAQPTYDAIRRVCCCPAILVSVSGPYIRFYGAVLADVVVVQPFTDYLYLGGDPDAETRIEHVAKIFTYVRVATGSLRSWYETLSIKPKADSIRHALPNPTSLYLLPKALLSDIHFVDRFDYPGRRHKNRNGESVDDFRRSLFRARLGAAADAPTVLVKFCFRYGVAAHSLLAKREPPLAPKLHSWMALLGGVTMIVMDIVPGFDEQTDEAIPPAPMADIKTAVAVLHKAGFVHGDVRRPNVVVTKRSSGEMGGMLLDFDWAGKEGEVRYPAYLNGELNWPRGVEAGSLISSAHDKEMLHRLARAV